MQSAWERRFFSSTRGRLVSLLRRAARTVEELAHAVDLTDNAVRAHLATLERDGLVRQEGVRRGPGSGKPAFAYCLTSQAEDLFPKAYGELLRQMLLALSKHLAPEELETVLREVARRLTEGRQQQPGQRLQERLDGAVVLLGELGGLAACQRRDDGYHITGSSCPLAAILPGNPEACHLAELLLEEATGLQVHEHCQREPAPRCHFHIPSRAS